MSQQLRTVNLAEADYAEIVELWQRAGLTIRLAGRDTSEAFARQMASGAQAVWGLRDGEQLVGVVIATCDGRKGWINRVAVDPAYRRQGLALRLIDLCEKHFRSLGIEVWAALVEEWNETSLALFRKAGYDLADDIIYASRRTRGDA